MKNKHCLVIGAGLAGLAAAHRLLENKWSVEVLEADTNRLGGRVFTKRVINRGKPDLVYELRGEWIGTSHKRVIQLCDDFRLKRMPHRFAFAFVEEGRASKFYEPGKLPFSSRENAAFKRFHIRLRRCNGIYGREPLRRNG